MPRESDVKEMDEKGFEKVVAKVKEVKIEPQTDKKDDKKIVCFTETCLVSFTYNGFSYEKEIALSSLKMNQS